MQHLDASLAGESSTDSLRANSALAELFREQRLPLAQFLLGLLRNRADADDALQQVFLKLVENWPAMRLETARSWLFTVAYHEALAVRRRRVQQGAALERLWQQPVWHSQSPRPVDDAAAQQEQVEVVRQTLAALPAVQREVVERRVYGEQTFARIAADMGCPLGTVLTRMRLALKTLGQLLED